VVRQTIQQHHCTSIDQVTRQCRAGGGCRSCHVEIHELLQEAARKHGMLKRFWLWLRC
jgi:NifU-like protein